MPAVILYIQYLRQTRDKKYETKTRREKDMSCNSSRPKLMLQFIDESVLFATSEKNFKNSAH